MYDDDQINDFENQLEQDSPSNSTLQGLGKRSLFVVGDDAQSIYAFRGSKIEIILGFEKEYPMTTEIILNQNYRSNQQILDLAEKVLTHNPKQKKKDLFTNRDDKTPAKYYIAKNERDEAEFVIRKIHDLYVDGQNLESNPSIETPNKPIDLVKEQVKSEFSIENLQELLES
jgi:superfamily I DNA/RNA helicase